MVLLPARKRSPSRSMAARIAVIDCFDLTPEAIAICREIITHARQRERFEVQA